MATVNSLELMHRAWADRLLEEAMRNPQSGRRPAQLLNRFTYGNFGDPHQFGLEQ